jgi:hypothetical protein
LRFRAFVAGTVVLVAVVAAWAAEVRVVLHSCIAPGWLTLLSLRFDLIHPAASCPQGTYGLTPASQGAVVLLSVALPALVAHLVLIGVGVATSVNLVAALRAFGRLLLRWRTVVDEVWDDLPVPVVRVVVSDALPVRGRWLDRTVTVRGPPAAVVAA